MQLCGKKNFNFKLGFSFIRKHYYFYFYETKKV